MHNVATTPRSAYRIPGPAGESTRKRARGSRESPDGEGFLCFSLRSTWYVLYRRFSQLLFPFKHFKTTGQNSMHRAASNPLSGYAYRARQYFVVNSSQPSVTPRVCSHACLFSSTKHTSKNQVPFCDCCTSVRILLGLDYYDFEETYLNGPLHGAFREKYSERQRRISI